MTTSRTKDGKFLPGSSGNPSGRKPGSGRVAKLRESIEEHVPEIIARMVTEATLFGDVQAARLLLERVIPAVKPTAAAVYLPELGVGNDGVSQARAVIDAIAEGRLPPDTGAGLLAALANHGRLLETRELERRVAELEKTHES